MCKVLSVHNRNESTDNAVYIGRPSKWGNPFLIGKDGDRETVIAKYEAWLESQPELVEAAKRELRGKDLLCYCSPQPCHGDVLLEIANDFPKPQIEKEYRVVWEVDVSAMNPTEAAICAEDIQFEQTSHEYLGGVFKVIDRQTNVTTEIDLEEYYQELEKDEQ